VSIFFAKSSIITMSSSNKRRRTTTSNNNGTHIKDLPDGILVGISSYLAKPSAVLFALSMTIDSRSTQTSKAIISKHNWNVLDFSDIEKRLASKLRDCEIDTILRSIDAVSNLKILKLGGCVKITGSGLDLLRSSVVIQQIDMSLVGKHEAPTIKREPKLSEDIVLPILDDIISRGRASSLKQLELPKKWRDAQSTDMDDFLARYNGYLRNQRYSCSKCDRVCVETGRNEWIGLQRDEWHGIQNYTCFGCLNHFCYDGDCVDGNGDYYVQLCKKCEKVYCKVCISTSSCSNCYRYACNECEEMKTCEGEDCERTLCVRCFEKKKCYYCKRSRCLRCVGHIECQGKTVCIECNQSRMGRL